MATGLKYNGGAAQLSNVTVQSLSPANTALAKRVISTGNSNFASSAAVSGLDGLISKLQDPNSHGQPISRLVNTPVIPVHTEQAPLPADNQFQEKFRENATKFQPYESLTGISRERPEIVMLTQFQPIFDDDHRKRATPVTLDGYVAGLNTVGDYLDVQIQVGNLQLYNIGLLIENLKNDDAMAATLQQQQSDFVDQIKSLTSHVGYLYSVVNQLDQLKASFDLQDPTFNIPFNSLVRTYFNSAGVSYATYTQNQSTQTITPAALLSKHGYSLDNVKLFASTKVYLQLLYEFDQLCRNYSYDMLNVQPSKQSADVRPVDILQHAAAPVNERIAALPSPVFAEMLNVGEDQLEQLASDLGTLSMNLLAGVSFPTLSDRTAFLITLISKEYRYSSNLAVSETKRLLSAFYNYSVNSTGGNASLFDFIVGRVGSKITNVYELANPSVLTSAAQLVNSNLAVLPFEGSYLTIDGSTFTPGTDYLIDSMLDVNAIPGQGFITQNLDVYTAALTNTTNRLSEAAQQLGFFHQIPALLNTNGLNNIDSPELFSSYVHEQFLDATHHARAEILNDPLSAVMNLAQSDPTLKGLLFLYFTLTGSGTFFFIPKGSQVLEDVIARIMARVHDVVPDRPSPSRATLSGVNSSTPGTTKGGALGQITSQLTSPTVSTSNGAPSALYNLSYGQSVDVPEGTFTAALQNGSSAISAVYNVIELVTRLFANAKAFSGDFTLFSSFPTTTLNMLAFELALSIINQDVGKKIIGKLLVQSTASAGKLFYSVTTKQLNATAFVAKTNAKVKAEVDLTLQTLLGVVGILQNITSRSTSVTNYLKSTNSTAALSDITNVLGSTAPVAQLMTEQQIYLLKSIVDDLNDKLFGSTDQTAVEISAYTASQINDDIRPLDESVITTNTHNALFAFLGSDKYAGSDAKNLRILTVGIPQNFTKMLKQSIRLDQLSDKNYNRKALDVVNCVVYKHDVEYQDIVFKPQRFLFELSRFVIRDDQSYGSVGIDASMTDLLEAIPSREYSVQKLLLQDFVYARQSQASRIYTDPEYSFLTRAQAEEILTNHVSSFMLELYIKLMSGVATSEYTFFIGPRPGKTIIPLLLSSMVDVRVSQRIGSAAPGGFSSATDSLDATPISRSLRNLVQHDISSISALSSVPTSLSDPLWQAKSVLSPKMFDRVFNIAVDPNMFPVDLAQTLQTPTGKEAFNKLVKQQMVYTDDGQLITKDVVNAAVPVYVMDRNKSEGHVIFEKYFVTFETVLGTEV